MSKLVEIAGPLLVVIALATGIVAVAISISGESSSKRTRRHDDGPEIGISPFSGGVTIDGIDPMTGQP